MLGKFGILVAILIMVLIFYFVISFGAKGEKKPEIKKYIKSVNILLLIIAIVGIILVLFM